MAHLYQREVKLEFSSSRLNKSRKLKFDFPAFKDKIMIKLRQFIQFSNSFLKFL